MNIAVLALLAAAASGGAAEPPRVEDVLARDMLAIERACATPACSAALQTFKGTPDLDSAFRLLDVLVRDGRCCRSGGNPNPPGGTCEALLPACAAAACDGRSVELETLGVGCLDCAARDPLLADEARALLQLWPCLPGKAPCRGDRASRARRDMDGPEAGRRALHRR